MNTEELPDRLHIEAIRRALWKPHGGAAVMVGAGVSRNARPLAAGLPRFPLWPDLVERLNRELHPGPHSMRRTTDALKLAEEYAQTFGRTRLDELILSIIRDDLYEPDECHKLLLNLPWTDVFTTNYDRLIERTPLDPGYHYELVVTPADIAKCSRPRLVKLNGSFPSQRPFVLTEEDYRRYPRDFAPLVNLVQQAVMENVFCLIGFSGDDPNFLQWAGWVRDHLGPAAPKMYLCGVLDLNASKRTYFESKHVVPVDLGPLFSAALGDDRHRQGLLWLLLNLHASAPAELKEWPTPPRRPPVPVIDQKLPELLSVDISPRELVNVDKPEITKPLEPETLERLASAWRQERLDYPGWVVCPEQNRGKLPFDVLTWMHGLEAERVASALGQLDSVRRLDVLFELIWRSSRALLPLDERIVQAIIKALTALNPRPSHIAIPGAKPIAGDGWTPSDYDRVLDHWVSLSFAVVNAAWPDQNAERFTTWMKELQEVVKLRPEWRARWHFETCWHHLLRLDSDRLNAALLEWPEDSSQPFWEAKRAAILADAGRIEEALRIAELALERVRRGVAIKAPEYEPLSHEGWLTHLVRFLRGVKGTWIDCTTDRVGMRTRLLREERCHPDDDLQHRRNRLESYRKEATHSKTLGFDPGRVIRSFHFGRSTDAIEWAVLQTLHDAPLPLNAEPSMSRNALSVIIHELWPYSKSLALSMAVRVGQTTFEDVHLRRGDVVALPQDFVNATYDWLAPLLGPAIHRAHAGASPESLDVRIRAGVPSILSRLTLRLDPQRLAGAFELALQAYRSALVASDLSEYDSVGNMLRRVLFAASREQLIDWMPKLLLLPLPNEGESKVMHPEFWPDVPFVNLGTPQPTEIAAIQLIAGTRIDDLIRLVAGADGALRSAALRRLLPAALAKILTQSQRSGLIGAVWSRTSEGTGVPADTGMRPSFLLQFPERRKGEGAEAVVRYLAKATIASLREKADDGVSSKSISAAHEYFRTLLEACAAQSADDDVTINLSTAEAEGLFKKLLAWWEHERADCHWVVEGRRSLAEQVRLLIRSFLRSVMLLLPQIHGEIELDRARVLISDLEKLGFSPLIALPATIKSLGANGLVVAEKIRRALHSVSDDEVFDAAAAIVLWHELTAKGMGDQPPQFLLDDMIGSLASRRQPGLSWLLQHATLLLERVPNCLESRHRDGLLRALQYLITETKAGETVESFFSPDEQVELRAHASELAARLAHYFNGRSIAVPPEVEAWIDVGRTDVLPEVRRPWLEKRAMP